MAANHLLRRTKTGGGPKNDLQIQRAGRKSRKSTTVFMGIKPYGKCQMNSKSFNPPRRATWGNGLVTTIKLAFSIAGLAGLMVLPAFGTERTWTGAAGVNWSSPNN
jgi:hypothetical protein